MVSFKFTNIQPIQEEITKQSPNKKIQLTFELYFYKLRY